MKEAYLLALSLIVCDVGSAGQRASTSYSISAETADMAGSLVTSPSYANVGSAGGIVGLSVLASTPVEIAKAGYIGQLFELTGLALSSAMPSVNETATVQLGVWQLLDDATCQATDPALAEWSVVSGPLTGISGTGVATADAVFEDTLATEGGTVGSFSATLDINVVNSNADNFGSYAGDGLDDSWQVQYFGRNNPLAAPNCDADGTGQTNLFKYVAGLNPLDPNSRFRFKIEPVPGQPARKKLVFSPRFDDRTYEVTTKARLSPTESWSSLIAAPPTDNGDERTVIDTAASTPTKFYRIIISKP